MPNSGEFTGSDDLSEYGGTPGRRGNRTASERLRNLSATGDPDNTGRLSDEDAAAVWQGLNPKGSNKQ